MPMLLKFEFTQEQCAVIVQGLDAILKVNGIQAVDAVQNVNASLQSQAKAQLETKTKDNNDGA